MIKIFFYFLILKLLFLVSFFLKAEKYILESLKSLKKQSYKNYSVFIADGGSKDRTLSLIKKSNLKYKIISKKDKSFEEGVNKCFDKLKTEYFMILGSDDALSDKKYLSKLKPKYFNSLALRVNIKDFTSEDISLYFGPNFHFAIYPKNFHPSPQYYLCQQQNDCLNLLYILQVDQMRNSYQIILF